MDDESDSLPLDASQIQVDAESVRARPLTPDHDTGRQTTADGNAVGRPVDAVVELRGVHKTYLLGVEGVVRMCAGRF